MLGEQRVDRPIRADLAPAVVVRLPQVSIRIFKGLLPLALTGAPAQRAQGARELKTVMERYLRPALDGEPPPRPPKKSVPAKTRRDADAGGAPRDTATTRRTTQRA